MKHSFFDTHPESAHPEIIKYLFEHNLDSFIDPAEDEYAGLGAKRIKQAFGIPDAAVHYFPNGTVTNVTALSAMLKPYEAVICPDTGHIDNYEAGAFEATGHKVVTVPTRDGKLNPKMIESVLVRHTDYLMVVPRVIYLTQLTEEGTVYTKGELLDIIAYARAKGLYTYVDGARLGMAIASETADITMKEFGALDLDMFYIGGGKNGALYGEALVIKNDKFKPDFLNYMKRRGAAMGKQRPLDLQFARFFDEDNLWLEIARYANSMGRRLRDGLVAAGADLTPQSDANHAFLLMKEADIQKLESDFEFARWGRAEDGTVKIRLVCGWSTKTEDVDEFLRAVKALA